MASIVPLMFSMMFAKISVRLLRDGNTIGIGFACGTLILGGFGLYTLLSLIANRRIWVEVNEDGIVNGTRLWKWNEIDSFTGKRYFNGVCIEFASRWRRVSAPTTPLLTERQYIELAIELHRRIVVRFPNIKLAMFPLEASDKS